MVKRCIFLILCLVTIRAASQPVSGTTGLLNIPTADMQNDGTIMSGANFLPPTLTPATWDYNTWNYYVNITFLPFIELSYRMTLFKLNESKTFNNQDRSIAARLRILKEKKNLPSIVFGVNDLFASDIKITGSRYFSNLYIVGTKTFSFDGHQIKATAGYKKELTTQESLTGFLAGISYSPSFLNNLKFMADYDSNVFNIGAGLLLFNHLYLYGMAHNLKNLAGGFSYLIYLKHS